mmetsp:Transcript_96981/g.145300  ORF Transcript_96981/g.145300 Transcript_96981/m.145300 type:complete len:117 (-) Transcript_96981:43-393(-)
MPQPANQQEKEELAITYAALILHDDGLPITEENLNAILTAADVKVQPFWPRVFAKLLEGKDSSQIDDIILGGGAAPAVAGGAAAGGAEAAAPVEEAKPVEEEEEESDEDMGFGLFD